MDVYRALLGSRRSGQRVGLWGHIRSYVSPHHPVDAALERWQLRSADHIFAYAPGGARFAIDAGVPQAKVTTVMNSVATEDLLATVRSLSRSEVDSFADEHGLTKGKIYAFVGGLDSSKRIDFLAKALNHLWDFDPIARVIVGGVGDQSRHFDLAVSRGQVIMIGRAGTKEFALIAHLAEAILMPGRIGLIAVEALALRIPIITTDWPFHAPEVEYLKEGVSMFTAPNEPQAYARFISTRMVRKLETTDYSGWDFPSLQAMVDNFSRGVRSLLP
ncbi:glycosyltransferase [Cryobacterium sp. TMT1-21]|uniref:glycosyltransferase n=1 Tax=Cryobacterium sp. TMT1-21 TaxID=1259234 RepID=UPI00106AA05A|nr:glycosyltransferase [Cryobacterium sp. TMT1-21]TFD17282.1 glycosyltransferase [Cryobacterium sp. TMT1-21]